MAEGDAWFKDKLIVNKLGYPCLTYSKALEYIKNGFSCLFEVERQRQVGLSPRYIGKIDVGIRETLDSDLLKYSEELSGIIVCYKQVQCLETSGCIMDETPFLYFIVNVKYIIFRPQVGSKLKGVVNKVGHSHFGCIVHECFNASVHKINNDTSKQSKKILKKIAGIDVGTELVFRITRFDIHNDILSIKGKIDSEDFANIRNPKIEGTVATDELECDIKKEEAELNFPSKKKKKMKDSSLVNGIASSSHLESIGHTPTEERQKEIKKEEEESEEKIKIKHKKNKRKHSNISQTIKVENDTEEIKISEKGITPKKKKKQK